MPCNLCHNTVAETLPFHYLWRGKRFEGQRCTCCGLIWLDPLPTEAELATLYDEDYFADGLHGLDRIGSDYEKWADSTRDSARTFLRREIRSRHPAARALYEIGGAMGHFLAAAREDGFTTGGIEISATAVEKARQKFGLKMPVRQYRDRRSRDHGGILERGLRRRCVRTSPRSIGSHRTDRHPVGPRWSGRYQGTGHLQPARSPSGSTFVETRRPEKPLPDNPYHLYEYTGTTIRRMLERRFEHVEVIQQATPPQRLSRKTGSLDYWVKIMLQAVNYPLTSVTNRFGDRMTVYARKPSDRDRT